MRRRPRPTARSARSASFRPSSACRSICCAIGKRASRSSGRCTRAGNRRYYRPADVALVRRIDRLLNQEGYTVRGVQKLLGRRGTRDEPAPTRAATADAPDAATEPGHEIRPPASSRASERCSQATREHAAARASARRPRPGSRAAHITAAELPVDRSPGSVAVAQAGVEGLRGVVASRRRCSSRRVGAACARFVFAAIDQRAAAAAAGPACEQVDALEFEIAGLGGMVEFGRAEHRIADRRAERRLQQPQRAAGIGERARHTTLRYARRGHDATRPVAGMIVREGMRGRSRRRSATASPRPQAARAAAAARAGSSCSGPSVGSRSRGRTKRVSAPLPALTSAQSVDVEADLGDAAVGNFSSTASRSASPRPSGTSSSDRSSMPGLWPPAAGSRRCPAPRARRRAGWRTRRDRCACPSAGAQRSAIAVPQFLERLDDAHRGRGDDMIEGEPLVAHVPAHPPRGALALGVERAIEIARDGLVPAGFGVAQQRQPSSSGLRSVDPSGLMPQSRDGGKPRRDPRDRLVERQRGGPARPAERRRAAATAWRRRAARTCRDRRRGGSAGRTPAPAARAPPGRHARCRRRRRGGRRGARSGAATARPPSPPAAANRRARRRRRAAHRCRAARRADRRGRCRPACRYRSDRHAGRRAAARRARADRRCGRGPPSAAGSR